MNVTIEHKESPGTVTLVDLNGEIRAKHSSAEKEIILNPAPSADPNDPLNWSKWRKWRATLCALLFTWCICSSSSACFSVFVPIYEESGISLTHLNQGTGYMYLLFGWGLLFWQPLALTFGRRGVFLCCLLGTCMMNLWAGYAKTNGTWIATRILIGFFGSPSEALAEVVMADLWFTHERGTYMGLYVMALYGGQLAAVPAGYITNAMGWPWVLWWCSVLNAVGFVVCFFLMEETMYHREALPSINTPSTRSINGETKDYGVKNPGADITPMTEKSQGTAFPVKTYWQKLSPFVPLNGRPNTFFKHMYRPLQMFRFPGILFGGFIYGCFLNWFSVVNATVSIFLSSPPYNWSAASVGLSYIAELIGTYIAGFCAGKLADKLSIRLAKSNKGVMEPEFRLWLFGALAIIAPLGLFLYGLGYAHGLSYWSMLIGMVMVGAIGPGSGSLTVTYVVDCYRELAGEALISVILIRNTMNFGFNYGVTPWVDNTGAQNTFIAVGVLAFATTLTFLIMIRWGKKMRQSGAKAYWEYVEATLIH